MASSLKLFPTSELMSVLSTVLCKQPTVNKSTKPVAGSDGATTASVQEWEKKELKARTRLELAIGDSEMGHIVGADTAYDIWERLCSVKESKGRLGILSTRRALYRSQAQEGFDMVEHINNLRSLKAELALMSNIVSDEDFVMIVISSLPESWDVFTTSYLGAHSTSDETLKAVEFIPILLDEDRRRKSREGGSETSLQARSKKSDMECFNCRRKGHVKKDCWAKGGGKEGKGPRGRRGKERTNQATDNTDLNLAVAVTYMARFGESDTSKLAWHLDSGTTSHICTTRDAFITFTPLSNATIDGIGPTAAIADGVGSIKVNFKVGDDVVTHELKNVLFVPEAPNCLLSLSRFDESGGEVHFAKGLCELKDRNGKVVGKGRKLERLYLLDARAVLQRERANFANPSAKTWDQWHRVFGHIGMTTLERMHSQKLVDGFDVDESSIPSPTCIPCLEAKLTHQSFPKQAEHQQNGHLLMLLAITRDN
ncbi:hypothetical protein MD484_g5123, partial [Candolleomyces efflorescens]